jgi:hypothetical protein
MEGFGDKTKRGARHAGIRSVGTENSGNPDSAAGRRDGAKPVFCDELSGTVAGAVVLIATARIPCGFEAHAWVELNGCALDSESDEHREFIPFEGAIASVETQAK